MQSFMLRPADWEDLPAFKHIARTTLTEDIPALFDPNKLLEAVSYTHLTLQTNSRV